MTSLISVGLAQTMLIGIGVFFVGTTAVIYWRRSKHEIHTFDLKEEAPRPMVRGVPVAVPGTGGNVSSARQQAIREALSYRPQPIAVATVARPVRPIKEAVTTTKENVPKKTARMKLAEACASSKRILTAIRREVIPDRAMKQIQFFFAGVALGPFSEEQVRRYLREGYLVLSDLAKGESDTEWMPLQNILTESSAPNVESSLKKSSTALTKKIKSGPLQPFLNHREGQTMLVPRAV